MTCIQNEFETSFADALGDALRKPTISAFSIIPHNHFAV